MVKSAIIQNRATTFFFTTCTAAVCVGMYRVDTTTAVSYGRRECTVYNRTNYYSTVQKLEDFNSVYVPGTVQNMFFDKM